jgi:hypothetical protein
MVNMKWKWLWPILRHYSSICLAELGEMINKPVRIEGLWVEIQIGDPGI